MLKKNIFKMSKSGPRAELHECIVFILFITVSVVGPRFTVCADKKYFPAKLDQRCLNQSPFHTLTQSEKFDPGCYTSTMVSAQLAHTKACTASTIQVTYLSCYFG